MQDRQSSVFAPVMTIVWFIAGIVAVVVIEAADNQIIGGPARHKTLVLLVVAAWVVGLIAFSAMWALSSRGERAGLDGRS